MTREERTLEWIARRPWYGPTLKYLGIASEMAECEVRVYLVEATWRRGGWYAAERLGFGVN